MSKSVAVFDEDEFEIIPRLQVVQIEDSTIIEYILENFNPADVFAKEQLQQWAENDGYIKGEK